MRPGPAVSSLSETSRAKTDHSGGRRRIATGRGWQEHLWIHARRTPMTTPHQRTLEDKVALVVGGSGDIGSAIAEELATEGAHIVLSYLSDIESADRTVNSLLQHSVKASAVCSDAT